MSPGTFRKDAYEYWITVGPKSKRKQCHFTVRITEEGIDLEAFSPVKGFTSRFLRKIEAEPKSFIRCLQAFKIEAPYRFRLREAYYYDPTSSYKGQRISKRIDYLNVHPAFLTEKNLRQLIIEPMQARLIKRDFRPEILFVRHFALSELVGKPKVVDLVANAATPMLPYFDRLRAECLTGPP